mmetsp:Transcript_18175/g.50894  ORF Transcript_18175/g.50894 Transcript_18175/m.50894 type:complete len:108 (+) Transcript_18175:462-785(+)
MTRITGECSDRLCVVAGRKMPAHHCSKMSVFIQAFACEARQALPIPSLRSSAAVSGADNQEGRFIFPFTMNKGVMWLPSLHMVMRQALPLQLKLVAHTLGQHIGVAL